MQLSPTLVTVNQDQFWEINGNIDLAIIPANTIDGIPFELPIRLQDGNKAFGYKHILERHGHEFTKLRPPCDVFEFIYKKLAQGGAFHYQTHKRKTLFMSMHPSGVLILEYVKNGKNSYLSIVTCYTRQRGVDGDRVGSYSSRFQVKPSLVQPINVSNLQANGQQNTVQEIAATETIAVTNDST
ncbi:hypothetical protein [Acinetobacter baumannii]|uniref:hypothetical protein n=1 Tax=Acinetobacter baumannii TaxID=470 RepID=UPI003B43A547